jgi:hypothetical protein
MKGEDLRSVQAPLKERYRQAPEAALITLRAQGRIGEGVSCKIETGKALVVAGLHRRPVEAARLPVQVTCCSTLWWPALA